MNNEKINITAGRALEATKVLARLAPASYPSARAAYRIGRLLARLQVHPDITAAENFRQDLVRRLGVEKDGQISVPAGKLQEFVDTYKPVAETPVELDMFRLPLSTFDGGPALSPADMMTLQEFIEED